MSPPQPKLDARVIVAGKYLLGEELGAGGMGVVYRAQQLQPRRPVAIKFLHKALARDLRTVERFRVEALAASRLHHPNSVAVLDHGEDDDGTPFLVMEYVSGRTLRRIADDGALDIEPAIEICQQILAALGHAHSRGIVHSDVKTENVLVESGPDGAHVKLVDFGLARVICGFEDETGDNRADPCIAGTPEYMAPEVILGARPSPASDIYAVGVILYELLTGTTPFGGGTPMAIFARHVLDPLVPPSVRFPDRPIPRALEEVLARALAKELAHRFTDTTTFAAALAAVEPVQARAPHPETSRAVGACTPTLRSRPMTNLRLIPPTRSAS